MSRPKWLHALRQYNRAVRREALLCKRVAAFDEKLLALARQPLAANVLTPFATLREDLHKTCDAQHQAQTSVQFWKQEFALQWRNRVNALFSISAESRWHALTHAELGRLLRSGHRPLKLALPFNLISIKPGQVPSRSEAAEQVRTRAALELTRRRGEKKTREEIA